MRNIFISTTTFSQFSKAPLKLLTENNCKFVFNNKNRKLTHTELKNYIGRFDGVIAGTENYDSDIIDKAEKLKVISRVGVGVDNIDMNYALEKGIKVFKTQASPGLAVAELSLGLIFNLMRKIIKQSNNLVNGVWKKQMGSLLSRKTLGIVGLGTIGKKLIQITGGLELKYLAYDIKIDKVFAEKYNVKYCDLSFLLENADIISFHLNLVFP